MKLSFLAVAALQQLLVFALLIGCFACSVQHRQHKILVLLTAEADDDGRSQIWLQEIQEAAAAQHVLIDFSDDPGVLTEPRLAPYKAVVFLNVPAVALSESQRHSLEKFVGTGGGFICMQADLTGDGTWPWYERLLKDDTPGRILPVAFGGKELDATAGFRNYEHNGSRVTFINLSLNLMGSGNSAFQEQLSAVIRFVTGEDWQEKGKAENHLQELSRYHYNLLFDDLKEPMELSIADDGTVLVIEREGNLFQFDPVANLTKKIATVPVDATESGHGLQGITLDPDFATNRQLYLFYTPPKSKGAMMLVSRFTLAAGGLDLASEKILLKIPLDINQSGHLGGSLAFDAEGNLYIATGDNSYALHSDGFSPIDERPQQLYNDAQRSSGNTQDLRGKILRITPQPNGTYTIPANNLFRKDGSEGRPEIYVMGCRNPFRIAVDKPSGILYWGEVGPDAGKDSTRGPRGYDEINQVRKACNNGWPYFIGDNYPYAAFDFATGKTGSFFDPEAPVNYSPNNTGSKKMPPAAPAFIYYPYAPSEKFPELGEGARCALGGPVYHYNARSTSKIKFPEYYDKVLFIGDWSRNWIKAVYMDAAYNYDRIEAFMPKEKFTNPIDMDFGPDGALYVLEFGDPWGFLKEGGKLVRIEYNMGNRPPVAVATASETVGALPLTVHFSSKGSFDYDKGDALQIQWTLNGKPMGGRDPNPTFTFEEPGQYLAVLTVTDGKGMSSQRAIKLKLGNSRPEISMVSASNQSFYWYNQPFEYQVKVEDKEDREIDLSRLTIRLDYLPQGKDIPGMEIESQFADPPDADAIGRLISSSDCMSCHTLDRKAIGPAFLEIASKYKADQATVEKLAAKVIQGGGGVWGNHAMNPHPQLTEQEASAMISYILMLGKPASKPRSLPPAGSLALDKHFGDGADGKYLFTASYTDGGGPKTEPLTSTRKLMLRHPKMEATSFDGYMGVAKVPAGKGDYYLGDMEAGAYLTLKDIDLRGVDRIAYQLSALGSEGYIEIRLGSAKGQVISRLEIKPTGNWEVWKTQHAAILDPGGIHDLYVVFGNTGKQKENLMRLRWIEFQKKPMAKYLVSKSGNAA
ncbi:PQQ-dependent sugar dehydrogenase [Pontibacter beigongshangensis]|uniref:PQQ-dependent sugar dehydrogenase n=1 Tax=Pontibacter beigongshangensis TaxID=2574733 RepID=UPI00164F6BC1|nr:PQQ-dependent sugar dehydrogenase [Pontibacter beigongshangensis]